MYAYIQEDGIRSLLEMLWAIMRVLGIELRTEPILPASPQCIYVCVHRNEYS